MDNANVAITINDLSVNTNQKSKKIIINAELSDTISTIKDRISEELKIPKELLELRLGGTILKDDQTLEHYKQRNAISFKQVNKHDYSNLSLTLSLSKKHNIDLTVTAEYKLSDFGISGENEQKSVEVQIRSASKVSYIKTKLREEINKNIKKGKIRNDDFDLVYEYEKLNDDDKFETHYNGGVVKFSLQKREIKEDKTANLSIYVPSLFISIGLCVGLLILSAKVENKTHMGLMIGFGVVFGLVSIYCLAKTVSQTCLKDVGVSSIGEERKVV